MRSNRQRLRRSAAHLLATLSRVAHKKTAIHLFVLEKPDAFRKPRLVWSDRNLGNPVRQQCRLIGDNLVFQRQFPQDRISHRVVVLEVEILADVADECDNRLLNRIPFERYSERKAEHFDGLQLRDRLIVTTQFTFGFSGFDELRKIDSHRNGITVRRELSNQYRTRRLAVGAIKDSG